MTAPHATLEKLCEPLRQRGLLPERITPYVLHVAAACPPYQGSVLWGWEEFCLLEVYS